MSKQQLGQSWVIVCQHLIKEPAQSWNDITNSRTGVTEGHLCDECANKGLSAVSRDLLEPVSISTAKALRAGKLSLGDAPVEDRYRAQMVELARYLNEYFNGSAPPGERETGFVLLVFPFHSLQGRANYISNGACREDIVALFKEQIARFEGMPETQGHA